MRRHPMTNEMRRFPGLNECLAMMRSRHDPQMAEDGFAWLHGRAGAFVDEFIVEFQREPEHGVRCWLLELIGAARSEKALPILIEQAKGADESLRNWAVRGLKNLDTKPARTALWEIFGDQLPDV